MSPFGASHGDFAVIVSKPGMPFGVNPVAGAWSPWAMLSMIVWRSIASAIARRCFTSGTVLTLRP